jgi:glycosyltransferase involved in cell wall biosynthesis
MYGLVCISHLRWDFVWQRPQHLLSRMAKDQNILFVEEPITSTEATAPYLEILRPDKTHTPNVTVARLIQPADTPHWIGHGDPLTQSLYSTLLNKHLAQTHCHDATLWLYTPMAMDFVEHLPHQLLVFDVMDQLSAFKGAPATLIKKDKQLLQKADIVLTGGLSLYQDKKVHNSNTYLFPSGVEVEHFAKACQRSNFSCPVELQGLNNPILGYFGVIDERMDMDLISHISQIHPDWNIVLIGPVVKIDPSDLPQAPNLHYLGMKSYDQLPEYLAYFDAALIPFALNEATRYLSPTKTLEYLAAHKPVISTPIHDVVELYGDVVRVATTANDFTQQIQEALNEDKSKRVAACMKLLAQNTWDKISQDITTIIVTHLKPKVRIPASRTSVALGEIASPVSSVHYTSKVSVGD